ncbi:hypothetical protein OG401_23900 [Kitasatospora purpeofusca]|uniref:hypothetical protein n=1 Tax=Kitasatospora purpeofusca TaxID=67352 RepID=UPI00225C3E77|nr:hypothetical protein [Kitasatospora purpeofusca]MCX4687308.1 hypothetical protein [Kitasatospora purpeofusca]
MDSNLFASHAEGSMQIAVKAHATPTKQDAARALYEFLVNVWRRDAPEMNDRAPEDVVIEGTFPGLGVVRIDGTGKEQIPYDPTTGEDIPQDR